MKKLSILSIAVLAFFLASCTQTENSISPVAPTFNKTMDSPGLMNTRTPFPFPLLTAIKSFQVKSWNSSIQPNQVIVQLSNSLPSRCITFAVVEYLAPGPIGSSQKVMTFLNLQSGSQVAVPVEAGKNIQSIRIYGVSENTIGTVGNLYSDLQSFTNIKVDSWKSAGKVLTVSETTYNDNVNQVYAEINYNNSSVLVFMQKPSSQTFSIPGFGGSQVQSVALYGLTATTPIGLNN